MKYIFKIENEILSLNPKDILKTDFLIQSSPYNYCVKFIDDDQLKLIISINREINGKKNFLFTDKRVDKMYKKKLWDLDNTLSLVVSENNKTIKSALLLVDVLNKNNFTKKENLISIGGGIIQDVTAFARAIFKRGINWTYIPTTLLSMSDSCIGAKSAINYGGTKNLIGLFSAPKEIYINTSFLKTLNQRDILSGYGEIIKLCIVGGDYTIEKLNKIKLIQKEDLLFQIDVLIKTALMVKKAVITIDEFEYSIRKALNYGHTVGHGIEPIVKFKIPHGTAVLIGMYVENFISFSYGYLNLESCTYLNNIILNYIDSKSLRYLKSVSIHELISNMKKDKKNDLMKISFAVPVAIGHFKILQIKNDKKLSLTIDRSINNLLTFV